MKEENKKVVRKLCYFWLDRSLLWGQVELTCRQDGTDLSSESRDPEDEVPALWLGMKSGCPILFLHERPGKDEATPRTIHEAGSNPHSFRPPPPRRQQIPRELQLSGSKSVNYQLNHTTNSDIPSCFHQHTTFVLSAGSPAWQLALPLEQEQSAQYLAGPSTC